MYISSTLNNIDNKLTYDLNDNDKTYQIVGKLRT